MKKNLELRYLLRAQEKKWTNFGVCRGAKRSQLVALPAGNSREKKGAQKRQASNQNRETRKG